jgi:hypothetical protein
MFSIKVDCRFAVLAFSAFVFAGVISTQAQSGPIVVYEDHHDTSPPVRDLAASAPLADDSARDNVEEFLGRRPWPVVPSSEPDPVVQRIELSKVSTTNLLNFDGVTDVDGDAPPDTNASVGATQVVETVNTSYQVFDKGTGHSVFGPAEIGSIWSGFGGDCATGPYYSDPVVLYDKAAGRWLITIIGSHDGFNTGTECVAVSASSDATGSYHRYGFSLAPNLGDYPKFGVWPDAYYASYNVFGPFSYLYAEACAYDRANMLTGGAANAVCFQNSNDFSFLPSDLDGSGIATTGEPNFFVELNPNNSSSLSLFKFSVNFANPGLSTFSGPTVINVAPYNEACGGGTCIPQPGTGQTLDSLADRLMHRLAYRNFSDHEALVVTHSVTGTKAVSSVRWYEIRSPNATPVVFQQGTFAYSNVALWMASIAMDKVGDIAFGTSGSSSSVHPSIGYTGRVPGDPLGAMESPDIIKVANGSQTGGLNRWGDYSSMSIDPSDDCTFWYAQEYIPSNGSFNWNTRLASFKFKTCH